MSIYQFTVLDIQGNPVSLEKYKNKVLLIVNTASRCGFTPQYTGLEKLYEQFKDEGFEVLAFPCNQFGQQEPGSDTEIQSFCDVNYQISFPLFSKIEVNGDNTIALYQYLKSSAKGILGTEKIKWNFTKFLINRNGEVVQRYAPQDKPEKIANAVQELL
ncbi:glutathione peroxidase [Aliikangiella maris]|uniref:Glutathione peroxidase n=2 Tax=Aliikangiella maris TaxID=3162458 RepID=A0ABV2BVW0_9GAMM